MLLRLSRLFLLWLRWGFVSFLLVLYLYIVILTVDYVIFKKRTAGLYDKARAAMFLNL